MRKVVYTSLYLTPTEISWTLFRLAMMLFSDSPSISFKEKQSRPWESMPKSWTGTMPGCSSFPVTWASFTKRSTSSLESSSGRIRLIATKRWRSQSQARTTSAMTPEPNACKYSYFSGDASVCTRGQSLCSPRLERTDVVRTEASEYMRPVVSCPMVSCPWVSCSLLMIRAVSCSLAGVRTVFSTEQEHVVSWLRSSAWYRQPHFWHFRIMVSSRPLERIS